MYCYFLVSDFDSMQTSARLHQLSLHQSESVSQSNLSIPCCVICTSFALQKPPSHQPILIHRLALDVEHRTFHRRISVHPLSHHIPDNGVARISGRDYGVEGANEILGVPSLACLWSVTTFFVVHVPFPILTCPIISRPVPLGSYLADLLDAAYCCQLR